MHRRVVLALAFGALPGLAFAQAPRAQVGARHEQMLGQDFDDLPPGARERVQNAFRQGSPDLDGGAIRQRWNAMTPDQRGQTLTARERAQRGGPGPGRGPGAGPGSGRGPGPGGGPGPGVGPGPGPGGGPGPGRGGPVR